MKKPTRRERSKFPALKPQLNLKTRYDEILDLYSYMHKLNDAEKTWLNNFAESEINASGQGKNSKEKKVIYAKNNARNRCIMTRAKSQGRLVFFSQLSRADAIMSEEDRLIAKLDNKKKRKSTS